MGQDLDGAWERCVVYQLNGGQTTRTSKGSMREVGLATFEALEYDAREAASLIATVLPEFATAFAKGEVRVGSRRIEKARPDCPLSILHEHFLVVNAMISAGDALIPVRWQHAGDGAMHQLSLDMRADLREEMIAALAGVDLDGPMECPVILGPVLAAQLIHECIGHSSEADNYLSYVQPRGFGLGYQWCKYPINVYDDPTIEGRRASYLFDDDGQPARGVQVVTNGRWTDLLTSAEFAERVKRPAGHGRRVVGARRSLPRMANMWLSGGGESLEDLIGKVDEGIYCGGTWGGGSGELKFVIRPAFGRFIESGRLTKRYINRFDIFGDKREAIAAIVGSSAAVNWFSPVFWVR